MLKPYIIQWSVFYQYNEDDFSIQVFISNKLFSNYKFTSKQREAVTWQLLFVSTFMCIHAESLVAIKI